MFQKIGTTSFIATLLFFTAFSYSLSEQLKTEHKWTVSNGPSLVHFSSQGIHINQPDPKGLTYFAQVVSRIHLKAENPWKITFDLKFGQLRTAGCNIGLFDGDKAIGWIGADGWYKKMGCFVGKGNEVAAPDANTDWHRMEFTSDGQTVTIQEDGNVVGSGLQTGTPNLIKLGDIFAPALPVGSRPGKMVEGQQSEMWLRQVRIQSIPKLPSSETTTRSTPPSIPSLVAEPLKHNPINDHDPLIDNSNATLNQTQQWICNAINKSAGTLYRNGTDQQKYSEAYFDGNELIYLNVVTLYSMIIKDDYKVPMDKIDGSKVFVSKVNAVTEDDNISYEVKISVVKDADLISSRNQIFSVSTPYSPPTQGFKNSCRIWFGDEEMAERFAKAIRHAVKLCKANHIKEPF